MKLEVGEFYLNASGEIVKIENGHSGDYTFIDTNLTTYTEDGKYRQHQESKEDLIAHIPKELHHHICSMVSAYHTQPKFAEKVNEVFEIFNKKRVIPD